ncbi:hypothetical protein TrVE_jg13137 [Triparma verrucosa]|uniref:Uncharacterized protein n=2 Tax=Triparma TaxID=722752 RepID=A0A9W6ZVQ7_9STRA|nr:hypothetical protein TrST_g14302 [Triparma strigata]GMH90941.1 hypothetical protein TrVE_jg13137 [Triparma verrucosa]
MDPPRKKKRSDDGFKRGTGVNYSQIANRHIDDARHERPQAGMTKNPSTGVANPVAAAAPAAPTGKSAGMDAVYRLMSGQQERGIRDKLDDPNRPTWEKYKKDNADKLDLVGEDKRKMEEYRRDLDKAREERLSRGLNHGGDKKAKKEKKEKKKKHKKDKKKKKKSKKEKKKKRSRESSDDSDSDSDSDSEEDSGEDNKYSLASFFKGDESGGKTQMN